MALALIGAVCLAGSTRAAMEQKDGEWVAGDFHQHTTYTDGSNPIATVMYYNDYFGLDWWANSEHGGVRSTDAFGPIIPLGDPAMDTGKYARYWDDTSVYPAGTILGDVKMSGGHQQMWRWQSLLQYSFPDILTARALYRKPIVQGVEWNVPGHEHCSVGIIADEFTKHPDAAAISAFEYQWDAADADSSLGAKNTLNDHAKAVQAVTWMQENYGDSSWVVFAHVERRQPKAGYVGSGSYGYTISDFRDFNNAGPDVAFGFESMPGHQKESGRGGYSASAVGGGTYGGCGIYAAKVGGLWDALLGEGRSWWLFASSDFHLTSGDFWPGEYQKTYAYVADKHDPQSIVDGMRSGNGFVVEGDLINALDFHAQYDGARATMGEWLPVEMKKGRGNPVKITIRFKSPSFNNNGDAVRVDHIDLIAGDVTGSVPPGSPDYNNPENPSARVIERFTAPSWTTDDNGWNVIQYHVRVDHSMYFRLRGTNNALNSPEIDQDSPNGDPALDLQDNTPEKAWQDLWFYSNPIFIDVSR